MLCPADDCHFVTHLLCIAPLCTPPTELLPKTGQCPKCDTRIIWGEVIRGSYTRKERSEAEQEELQKAQDRVLRKSRRKKVDKGDESSSQAISELSLDSPTKRSKSEKGVRPKK
jgi:hypothetical protein